MLNQHYLDPMFPLSKDQKQVAKAEKGVEWKSGGEVASHNEDDVGDKFDDLFLDRIVTPDEKLALRRDLSKILEMGNVRRDSGLEFGSGQVLKDAYGLTSRKDGNSDECLTFKRTASDRVVAEEARGKTVKDLSRLWRYVGGKSPTDREHSKDEHHHGLFDEHRKHRHDRHHQRKADQELGDGPVFEQQKSPILLVFERPKSPFPHPSLGSDEQFFHVSSFCEAFLRRSPGDLVRVGPCPGAHPLLKAIAVQMEP